MKQTPRSFACDIDSYRRCNSLLAAFVQIPLALLHLVRILCDRRLSNIYYSNVYYFNIILLPFTVATEKSLGYLP